MFVVASAIIATINANVSLSVTSAGARVTLLLSGPRGMPAVEVNFLLLLDGALCSASCACALLRKRREDEKRFVKLFALKLQNNNIHPTATLVEAGKEPGKMEQNLGRGGVGGSR